jgi:hypothetical protein
MRDFRNRTPSPSITAAIFGPIATTNGMPMSNTARTRRRRSSKPRNDPRILATITKGAVIFVSSESETKYHGPFVDQCLSQSSSVTLENLIDLADSSLVYPLWLRDLSHLSAPHVSSIKLSELTRASWAAFHLR